MKTFSLLAIGLLFATAILAQSSLPVISVTRFEDSHGDQVATAVFTGFTNSKRVKMVDIRTMDDIRENIRKTGGNGPTILKSPTYLVSGRVNAVNFSSHSTRSTDGKTTYYNDCEVAAELKLTNVVTNESEFRTLRGTASTTGSNEEALQQALRDVSAIANGYARSRFPAALAIVQILSESERKGITSFRAQGEGLTEKGASSGGMFDGVLGPPKTHISIKHRFELTKPDGTTLWISEEVGEAKIAKVEDGDDPESKTAICTVTKGGEKLRELWNKKATLLLITTN